MNKKIIILCLIIAIAAFFRFWQIQNIPPGLYPDEAMNGNNALEAIEKGDFKIFYPENNGREGLFINIQAASVAIFGNKPWALRLVSSAFGVLTVLGVYFLTKELFNFKNPKSKIQSRLGRTNFQNSKQNSLRFSRLKFGNWNLFENWDLGFGIFRREKIALISCYFLATSLWHINFSRIGFRAIMAPFFLVWGLYFLLKSLNFINFENCEIKNSLKIINCKLKIAFFSIISGLVYGLGFHSYIAYRATPVLIILIFAYFWFKQKENRRKIIFNGFFFIFSFFIVISPLLFYFYQNPADFLGRTSQISVFSSENPIKDLALNTVKTFGMFWYQGDYNWRHNFSGRPELFWPIGILFGLGILMCIYRILNPNIKNPMSNKIPSSNDQKTNNLRLRNFDFIGNCPPAATSVKVGKLGFGIFDRDILPELLLLFWLIIGLAPVIVSNEGIPHALRAIIIIPAVMIISAVGLEAIIKKVGNLIEKWETNYAERALQIQRIKKELFILLILFFISTGIYSFDTYFLRWAGNPNVADAFSENYADIGNYLNSLPKDLAKYVVVNANDTNVRGMPMPTQTIMFITKTFLPQWQKEKNISYILPENIEKINCASSCVITTLENDSLLRKKVKDIIPGLTIKSQSSFITLEK